jgi:hypothetical protein
MGLGSGRALQISKCAQAKRRAIRERGRADREEYKQIDREGCKQTERGQADREGVKQRQ